MNMFAPVKIKGAVFVFPPLTGGWLFEGIKIPIILRASHAATGVPFFSADTELSSVTFYSVGTYESLPRKDPGPQLLISNMRRIVPG